MEKTKRDSRHIDPLKDEEKFFQWLKFKSVRMNQEHLSKDDYERLASANPCFAAYVASEKNGQEGSLLWCIRMRHYCIRNCCLSESL